MLPKKERLGRKDIELFFREKTKTYKGSVLLLKIKKRTTSKDVRWAFAISSAIKKNAVARNKTRRRMNEIAENLKESIQGGLDMVFLIKLNTKRPPSFKTLKDDMIHILKSCGVLL